MIENFKKIWDEYPSAVTISNMDNTIIYMNKMSLKTFANDGGEKLIGSNLLDCHNENSKLIIQRILETKEANTYTIEKRGLRKLIHQSPWYLEGEIAGLIELSIVLPTEMSHFKRD